MRKARVAAVLVVLLLFSYIVVSSLTRPSVEVESIKSIITEDLKSKVPYADEVGVVSVSKSGNGYVVKAFASFNLSSKCPSRNHYIYVYPSEHFTYDVESIVSRCSACVGEGCRILYPEEAVIASWKNDEIGSIEKFISSSDAVPHVKKSSEGWIVEWTSENDSLKVLVGQKGDVQLLG